MHMHHTDDTEAVLELSSRVLYMCLGFVYVEV